MSDEWFAKQLAPDSDDEDGYQPDGCHPDEAKALKDYLDHRTTANEAAREITRPVVNAKSPQEDQPRLWAFLTTALLELPSEHVEPLISLLRAIDGLPDPDYEAIEESGRPREKLWKGLPGFGHNWADYLHHCDWKDEPSIIFYPNRDSDISKHVRKAEIEARLVAAGLARIPIDWGYEAVADALESSNAVLDIGVPVASKWIQICGQQFQKGAEDKVKSWALKPRSTNLHNAPRRDLWDAPTNKVMNVRRWNFWGDRLRTLHNESVMIQDAAKEALQAAYPAGRFY